MCELLGFTSKKEYDVQKVLREFFTHSKAHPDGWGCAIYQSGVPTIIKEPMPAYKSKIARMISENEVKTNLTIAHIRKASRGSISISNTHPFVQKVNRTEYVLAHNGTIRSQITTGYEIYSPIGDTDSEKILCLLSDTLACSRKKNEKVFEDTIEKLTLYGKLNLLFSDGNNLYIHTNEKGTLYYFETDGFTIFATMPFPIEIKGFWKQVPLNVLMVYQSGCKIYHSRELKGRNGFEDLDRKYNYF